MGGAGQGLGPAGGHRPSGQGRNGTTRITVRLRSPPAYRYASRAGLAVASGGYPCPRQPRAAPVAADALWRAGRPSPCLPASTARGCTLRQQEVWRALVPGAVCATIERSFDRLGYPRHRSAAANGNLSTVNCPASPERQPAVRPGALSAWTSLQVVADYTRLSAVQTAGRAGQGRASGPQYPGLGSGGLWRATLVTPSLAGEIYPVVDRAVPRPAFPGSIDLVLCRHARDDDGSGIWPSRPTPILREPLVQARPAATAWREAVDD
jgi:hypothetical protein